MKDLWGLTGFLAVLVILAVALAVLAELLAADRAKLFIPSPENTADGLVEALAAHRYEGVLNQLSQDLKQQVSAEDLQALVKSIEDRHQGIQDSQEESSQENSNTASAALKVKLGDNQERSVHFPLVKEHGLWKVTSLDAIQALAQ